MVGGPRERNILVGVGKPSPPYFTVRRRNNVWHRDRGTLSDRRTGRLTARYAGRIFRRFLGLASDAQRNRIS